MILEHFFKVITPSRTAWNPFLLNRLAPPVDSFFDHWFLYSCTKRFFDHIIRDPQFAWLHFSTPSGSVITLFYADYTTFGAFPYVDRSGKEVNGGIPQRTNITRHLELVRKMQLCHGPYLGLNLKKVRKYICAMGVISPDWYGNNKAVYTIAAVTCGWVW